MKRLAYLLADFPVLSETFIGNEIRAMRAKGHDVLPLLMRLREGMAQPEDRLLAETAHQLKDLNHALGAAFLPIRPGWAVRSLSWPARSACRAHHCFINRCGSPGSFANRRWIMSMLISPEELPPMRWWRPGSRASPAPSSAMAMMSMPNRKTCR